jgi:hypothetical protein
LLIVVSALLPSDIPSEASAENRRESFLLLAFASVTKEERRRERPERAEPAERAERTEPESLLASSEFLLRSAVLPRIFFRTALTALNFSGVCTAGGRSSVSSRQFATAKAMGVQPFRSCMFTARWITYSCCLASASTSRARIGSEAKTDA